VRDVPMKPKAKMLVLILGLMLPYMGFVLYRAFTHPQHPFPNNSSVIWPPSWRLFLLLLGVLLRATLTSLIFFRAPRSVGVVVLFLQAGIAFYWGGTLGWFFIFREFEAYHFSIDAEKLGEYWFVFEAVGIWTLVAAALAVLRVFARKQLAENSSG
jgi:hypothetical protein